MTMDILAWVILAVVTSTLILPALAALMSSDPYITYKEAWGFGHAILFCGLFIVVVLGAVIWASERVLW